MLFHVLLCGSPKWPVNKPYPFFTFRDGFFFIPIPISFFFEPRKEGIIGGYMNPPSDFGVGGLRITYINL